MISQKQKNTLLSNLSKTPIVSIACRNSGASRATYYRWRKEDKEFAKEADKALADGSLMINDMAESQLLSAIRDKNLTAIIFWLKNHHKTYANKLELCGKVEIDNEPLTNEQELLIKKALELAGLNTNTNETQNDHTIQQSQP